MTEHERILELIKQGVLSTEEGLDLLENLAKKEDKRTEEKEFDQSAATKETFSETVFAEEEADEDADFTSETAQADLEDEYEALANEMNQYSAKLDQLNEELAELKSERNNVNSRLNELTSGFEEDKKEKLDTFRADLNDLNEELRLVQSMEEVDNRDEVKQLKKEVSEVAKEIDETELTENTEHQEEIGQLRTKAEELDEKIEKLQEEKTETMKVLHSYKMKQWSAKAKNISSKFEIPKDWKDEANTVFTKASETMETTGKDLSDVLKKSLASAKTAFESVEWKDKNFKVPTIASTSFEKEWKFDEFNPTILDFKNANGAVRLEESEEVDSIQVHGEITLYGKMDEETSEKAFEARSMIAADEDKLSFHIPNKRVKADLIVKLPKQTYDYIALNVLNGDVVFEQVDMKDMYAKTANGNFQLNGVKAIMAEIKGTNGNVLLNKVDMRDLIVSTINGDVRVKGHVNGSNIVTTAGAVRLTLHGEKLTHLEASSVNGDIKVAVPNDIGIEAEAKTVFGQVKSRFSDIQEDIVENQDSKKNKRTLVRPGDQNPMRINVKTTTGNILFKDTETSK